MLHYNCNGDAIYGARIFRNDPSERIDPVNIYFLKSYQINTISRSLNIVCVGINVGFVIT